MKFIISRMNPFSCRIRYSPAGKSVEAAGCALPDEDGVPAADPQAVKAAAANRAKTNAKNFFINLSFITTAS